jgi:hypothetical protein
MDNNDFQFKFTHQCSDDSLGPEMVDIRPEAINYALPPQNTMYHGRKSGDVVINTQGHKLVILGVNKYKEVNLLRLKNKITTEDELGDVYFTGLPNMFDYIKWEDIIGTTTEAKTTTEVETSTEVKTPVKRIIKRKTVEVEVESDEEIGEIKFIKKIKVDVQTKKIININKI